MRKIKQTTFAAPRHSQKGLGIPEILIAATIGLLLMGALFSLFVSTKQTFRSQTQLSQLQDAERLAMTMIKNVLQAGGYYPDPINLIPAVAFPVSAPFTVTGQFINGTTGATPAGDSITVRYVSASGDGLMNCLGNTNTTGANFTYVNVLRVDALQNLTCSVNGAAAVALINGVQRMTVAYGVDTDGDGSINRYMGANIMSPANWSSVRSVRIDLTFVNPLAGQAGQNATVGPFTQVISVKGRT